MSVSDWRQVHDTQLNCLIPLQTSYHMLCNDLFGFLWVDSYRRWGQFADSGMMICGSLDNVSAEG
jgi:hypothetical protein